ncbi:MAG TPA: hypothetical protein VGQ36_21725 [Thermoanaerobaculia bacterium]|jgi:hypothetical protein|nr:hypothetical protein [Thermoanaerobaculia bacterium]
MTTTEGHRLQQWVEGGISVIVGTADADKVPTCCRAIAISTKDNFETVTVYIPAVTGQETIANVATTRRVAISCTAPLSHGSIQIKGISRGVKLALPTDEEFVRTRLHQFADVLAELGLPRRVTHRITHWPAFAIDVSVEEVFDQTPGPRAGFPLAC